MEKEKAFLLATLFTVIVLSSSLAPVNAVTARWGIRFDKLEYNKESYYPGDSGIATVVYHNIGNLKLKITKVEMKTDFGTYTWIGEVEFKGERDAEINILFTIPDGTNAGEYRASFYIEFGYWWRDKWEGKTWEYSPDTTMTIEEKPVADYAMIGVTVLGIALIVLVAFVYWRRKTKKPEITPSPPVSPSLPPPPPTTTPPPVQHCPDCGAPASYVQQYQRYYCQRCQKYI